MNEILLAPAAVASIGIVCAVLLTVVSKFMRVDEDERMGKIRAVLPGVNCGSCGFAGCDGYASALVNNGAATNLCVPGADSVSRGISDIMGVPYLDVVEQVAVVRCGCTNEDRRQKLEYAGIRTCAAAKLHFGGEAACTYGCIGLSDCVKVCPTGALCVKNGVAHVNLRLCIGCGLCAKSCPNNIISIHDGTIAVLVVCSSRDKGADTRKKCDNGCIACKRCERECPTGAIKVVNNLAEIDYEKCVGCNRCVEVCPAHCIKKAIFRTEK